MNNQNDTNFSLYGILFFSNKCKYCEKLRNVIYMNGLGWYIQEMCIDEMREEQIVQWGLEVVPTLVVIYENRSQGIKQKTVFKQQEVFEWVEQRVIQRREMMKNSSESTRQNIIAENIMNKKKDNIHDYHPLETNSQSDIYSYWFKDIAKDNGLAQPKSFLPFNNEDQNDFNQTIETYNEKNSHKYKLGERETKQLMENMLKSRTTQSGEFEKINETKRLLAAKKKLGAL